MTKNILTTLFLLFSLALNAQPGDASANAQPLKCYVKCLIPAKKERTEQKLRLPIYTGVEYDDPLVKKQKLTVLASALPKSWQQPDPNESMTQDTVIRFWVVTDTTQLKEYEWITFTIVNTYVTDQGGFTEWREVLCSDKVTASIVTELHRGLKQRGYDPGKADNVMGMQTKKALAQFQKDNGLPVGNLDFETLEALGVTFKRD
jgi:Putative peptidoglycan binding domain